MDSDSGGEKRLISVRARGGEINECRDVICNICMVGSSYWGCDYEKTTTRNMDIISGLGCSRMYLTYIISVYKDYITGSAYKYQMFEKGTAKTHWQAYFNSYKSSENQVLFDKVIDTLGDSITEQRTWQGYVADALHTGVIYNHGIGGTRISGNDSNAMWQDSRINALNDDIDCLLIMGGTNDGAQGVTIGDMSRDNVNTDTFVGAYNVLLSKVFYKYYRLGSGYSGITQISEVNPIQIMIATPIYCNDSNYGNMDEIAEAVRGVANLWSIPVADQHAKSGINSATSSIYLSDNVHPNDEGGKKVANVWVNALKSNAELIN